MLLYTGGGIHREELISVADKTSKAKPKRLPKGQRTHVRRLKQAARKAGIAYRQSTGARTEAG
jgi:hypothetical protein